MAGHCFKLWILCSGGFVGRCVPTGGDAHDTKDMCLCMDCLYGIPDDEKREYVADEQEDNKMDNKQKQILKLINTAGIYAILAMAGGVFYREFTKFHGFSGRTTLAFVHTHLFLLGMVFFLMTALFELQVDVSGQKRFSLFWGIYQIGVAVAVAMLIWRGILQVLGTEVSRAIDASISGIAGIGHICIGIGMILYFGLLKKAIADRR